MGNICLFPNSRKSGASTHDVENLYKMEEGESYSKQSSKKSFNSIKIKTFQDVIDIQFFKK